jgi:hypothetical protein
MGINGGCIFIRVSLEIAPPFVEKKRSNGNQVNAMSSRSPDHIFLAAGVPAERINSNGRVTCGIRVAQQRIYSDKAGEAILPLKPVTFHYKSDAKKHVVLWFNR